MQNLQILSLGDSGNKRAETSLQEIKQTSCSAVHFFWIIKTLIYKVRLESFVHFYSLVIHFSFQENCVCLNLSPLCFVLRDMYSQGG